MIDKKFPTDFTLKSNPVDADLLIIADTEDNNEMKKITIGSITGDIADWIINDSASSTTTTYSSDKINALDAAINTIATTDASTSAKGRTKLSVAPASASNPIAVGDNDGRVPTQSENDALAGTIGTPSGTNKYVTNDDTSATTSANKVYRLKASGKIDATMLEWALPALDGSALTGVAWDPYSSSTNATTTYHNDIFKTTRPTLAAGSSISGVWFEYFHIDNGSTGAVNYVWWTLKGTGSANSFIWSQSKKVRIRWNARYDTGSNNWGLWLAVTATSLGTAETDTTTGTARVLVKNGVLWFCTANGSYEATNVDSGITDGAWNEYMMEINPWVNIKLYINGNLVADHTTIPTTGTPSWTVGVSTGSSNSRYMGLSNLNISYEL